MEAKEKLIWSIALPGFGQILNGDFVKGTLFILLEIIINVLSNFNEVIYLSFNGQIEESIQQANYQWLLFYPCLYFFSMWDAFKNAGGGKEPYSFLPFLFSAYLVTVGIMYSAKVRLFGILMGVLWFPMLCVIPGLVIGFLIKRILVKNLQQ